MSELQLALAGVAAVLLLALYVNGKWQERRLLRRLRERLHGGIGDPLLQAQAAATGARTRRVDPRFAGVAGSVTDAPGTLGTDGFAVPADPGAAPAPGGGGPADADADADTEPGADERAPEQVPAGAAAVSSEALRTPTALLRPDWIEDPLLDCSLELRCARAVDGVSVIDAAAILAHTPWSLPVHFVVWDGRHQQWVMPDRFGYYTDALASIQLADRRSRLDAEQIERFVQVVRQVATALDADVDLPDAQRLLVLAGDLDRLCARFDIKIGLTVEAKGEGTWTGPQLRNAAQEAGFVATRATRWLALDAQGDPMYSLQVDPAAMNRLALELDIAVAPITARPFRAMAESAWTLAQALGASVVDDNGALIDARSVDAIEAQLGKVYADMQAAGIEPGSARARRLYV